MIFVVVAGATVFGHFLAVTRIPADIGTFVSGLELPPMVIMGIIIVIYLLLGCLMDSLAMILLTIPIFYPVIMGLDFWGLSQGDKSIWFGILALMVVEIGLITPPMGMNLFIIQKMSRNVPLMETARGVVPFLVSDLLRIVLLTLFPALALWLVNVAG